MSANNRRVIMHIDMDAFYASVELIDRPELVGTPVVVAGLTGRSVVLSATYDARATGIHAGMATSQARRLCPAATFIQPTFAKYQAVSDGVMEVFRSVTPYVEPLSLDEAFLDVTGATRRLGPPHDIAKHIKAAIQAEQRITCSVGVSDTKFVAKIASAFRKPDGLTVVNPSDTTAFLHPLPVGKLWGVGAKTADQLHRLGVHTVGELAAMPLETLRRAIGQAHGSHLHELANGIDPRGVGSEHGAERSLGHENTYGEDLTDEADVTRELLGLTQRTCSRLRSQDMMCRVVAIKVRTSDFKTVTRSITLARPSDVVTDIYAAVLQLWQRLGLSAFRIRLLGVRCERLTPADAFGEQLTLNGRASTRRDTERAMDKIHTRFGPHAVKPATLLADTEGVVRPPSGRRLM